MRQNKKYIQPVGFRLLHFTVYEVLDFEKPVTELRVTSFTSNLIKTKV